MPQTPTDVPTERPVVPASSSVAEKATVAPGGLPWITRMRAAQTARDPKATVSYVVARAGHDLPTVGLAPELSSRLRHDFAPGTVLQDRYRLGRELGRGGMGVVYLGRDQRLDRSVAIKVILTTVEGSSASATMDNRLKSSFAEEARMGASLTHPAIATVFDFGFHHESPFTVFEYIEGETLRELIERRGRLPLDEVRLIIGPLAQALDFAHARRIVHRDLKPENIRATEQRQFKILDLGLAREFSRQEDWRFAGTPAYAAPEQAAERPSDGRTDQYALALIVYELLTGTRPFESDSWLDLLEHHYATPPPAPRSRAAEIPQTVDAAILKSLEKDPNLRFSTCTELAVALGCQFLSGPAVLPQILLETEIRKMGGRWKTVTYPFSIRSPWTYLALAPDALWAIHRTELMRWPLSRLSDLARRGFRGLSFRIGGVTGKDRQWFRFKSRKECRRWQEQLAPLVSSHESSGQDGGPGESVSADADREESRVSESAALPRVEPVVLLKGRPAARFQLLGMVEAKGPSKRRAESGLAIRAAMMGADAVVDLNVESLPGSARTERRLSGMAVRAVDEEGRRELNSRWFASQIAHIRLPMLVLAILFGGVFNAITIAVPLENVPEISIQPLAFFRQHEAGINAVFWTAITSLTLGMGFLRWPQLVRPAATCFLAKAVQAAIAVPGNLAAAFTLGAAYLRQTSGFETEDSGAATLIAALTALLASSAVSISFLLVYLYLGRRAWRIDQEFRKMSAGSASPAPIPRARRFGAAFGWALAIFASLILLCGQISKVSGAVDDFAARMKTARSARAGLSVLTLNNRAWRLATDPDPARREAAEAVRLAGEAIKAQPDNATYLNTLGVAQYRAGDLQAAIETLDRSTKIRGERAENGFFLAMAHARLGHRELARQAYRTATADRSAQDAKPGSELSRFREEAAAILAAFDAAPAEKGPAAAPPAMKSVPR